MVENACRLSYGTLAQGKATLVVKYTRLTFTCVFLRPVVAKILHSVQLCSTLSYFRFA